MSFRGRGLGSASFSFEAACLARAPIAAQPFQRGQKPRDSHAQGVASGRCCRFGRIGCIKSRTLLGPRGRRIGTDRAISRFCLGEGILSLRTGVLQQQQVGHQAFGIGHGLGAVQPLQDRGYVPSQVQRGEGLTQLLPAVRESGGQLVLGHLDFAGHHKVFRQGDQGLRRFGVGPRHAVEHCLHALDKGLPVMTFGSHLVAVR
jgi:hypothetical protein